MHFFKTRSCSQMTEAEGKLRHQNLTLWASTEFICQSEGGKTNIDIVHPSSLMLRTDEQ